MILVSVIIPCYNSAEWIAGTLDSVFAQTYRNVEVILINDGSPDTEAFEQAIAPYREKLVYLKQENRGPSAARNMGILRARGEYVAFLDSDDSWSANYLAEQMQLLEATPSLDLVWTDTLFSSDPSEPGIPYSRRYPSRGPVTFQSLVSETCAVATSQTVARKKAVVAAGLFDERFWRSEDFHLWVRMVHRGAQMAYQNKALGWHRVRDGSLASDDIKLNEGTMAVLRDLEATLELSAGDRGALRQKIAEIQARLDFETAKQLLQAGRTGEAAACLANANRFYRRPKYSLALAGLRIAPWLVRQGIGLLEWWRSRRETARSYARIPG